MSEKMSTIIESNQMPEPETLVRCNDGQLLPAMFFYAIEGHDFRAIAWEHGFDTKFTGFDVGEDDDWDAAYEIDCGKVLREYVQAVPDGWIDGGRWHGEDGIVIAFLRRHA